MSIQQFLNIRPSSPFPGLQELLKLSPDTALFKGCAGSSPSLLFTELFESSDAPLFILVESSKSCEIIAHECSSLLGRDCASVFPSRDAIPYNMKSPFGPTIERRFTVLSQLMNVEKRIYIAPSVSLLQRVPAPKTLFNRIIRLRTGDRISRDELSVWLTENGFHRETMADNLGTFAIRGDIVDIYPFITENPVRCEFFDDTIESIRLIDVFSQRSHSNLADVEIFPMNEFAFSDQKIDDALRNMFSFCESGRIDSSAVRGLEHTWKVLSDFEGIEWFTGWFESGDSSIIEYLPKGTRIIWHDISPMEERFDGHIENYRRHVNRVPESLREIVTPPEKLLLNPDSIFSKILSFPKIYINTEKVEPPSSWNHQCDMAEQPSFPQSMGTLLDDLQSRNSMGYGIYMMCENIGHAERMTEILAEQCPFVNVTIGFLDRGFIDRESKLLYYAENQIFNRPHIRPPSKKFKAGQPLSGFDALAPGDYVVHIDHGIGRFEGIERIAATGVERDCMAVQYQDSAKLYVPVEDFHKVQKYIGKESAVPVLSNLGTRSWEKLKHKTRESLKEMARELIELYGKRQYLDGIQFSADSVWQKEFEDSFLFEETPDQRTAIADVKKDMESKKPMDRLVCGDVGFGKTEVAMRAAFKAVTDGYQVAILAPTTILAAQHYATFSERLASFPVKVAMLSRFRSAKEQNETVMRLKEGAVDIVIGTHRVLSKDVGFKNLGLLIVDEEQRFGVRHKESLKHYRYKVDVLSLTATPIPRTLHLSLIGARDLSIISTPPANRLPIETHVMEYHDQILKEAVENEIARGGQVFIVNNRISGLYSLRDNLEMMVPKARIAVAHGQMDEKELEAIMKAFIAGTFDVLISTMIIENGLDIPNVNTIIVNRADAMGLSQLYQLRGRVGRSSEQAFAYLLTPSFKQIPDASLKRLRALEQYTDLGSGFQIAMRDLEIRGAGNILGHRQHGFIAAVGFELYCRLLKEAVDEAHGVTIPEEYSDMKIDIALEAFIPPSYISDPSVRISVYQQLASAGAFSNIGEIESDLIDRFGALPNPVSSLLLLMRIKVLAKMAGAIKVGIKSNDILYLAFDGDNGSVSANIRRLFDMSGRQFEIIYGKPVICQTKLKSEKIMDQAIEVVGILNMADSADVNVKTKE